MRCHGRQSEEGCECTDNRKRGWGVRGAGGGVDAVPVRRHHRVRLEKPPREDKDAPDHLGQQGSWSTVQCRTGEGIWCTGGVVVDRKFTSAWFFLASVHLVASSINKTQNVHPALNHRYTASADFRHRSALHCIVV